MQKCKKCEKDIPEGSVFCPWCGTRQEREPRKRLKRANGTGTVYKMKGRRRRPWAAARNKVMIGYFETRREALEALERSASAPISERYNYTFQQVYEGWSAEKYPTLSKSAVYHYSHTYEEYKPLHKQKFRQLRTSDFQKIVDAHNKLAPGTLAPFKNLITSMSKWAMREEICTGNYGSYIRLPNVEKKEKEIFSEEDIRRLHSDNSETAQIILMLIYTGMRISELFELPTADYYITYLIGGEKSVAGRERVIPIPPAVRPCFQHFCASADPSGTLLSGYRGHQIVRRFRSDDYYPCLDRLGIARKTPHATRHTYASRAARAGMPREVLMKILGHASYTTTAQVYVHQDISQLIFAAENAFSGAVIPAELPAKNDPKNQGG